MKWYYAANREKLGPIDQAAFEQLVASGIITDSTLVWRKGMPKWEPFAQVKMTVEPEPEPPTAIPLPATQNEVVASAPPPPPPNPASAADPVQSPSSENSDGVICAACGGRFQLMETVRFGDRHVCQPCRPAYVEKAWDEQEDKESGDGHVREANLKYERRIRTAAAMYYFVSGLFVFVAFGAVVNGKFGALLMLPLAAGIFIAAREIFRLRKRAKLAAGIVSGVGLLMFPIGTVIHAIVLYLVFCKDGRRVLSDEHGGVIERTPEIKCPISWIGAALLSAGIFVAFATSG